MINVNTSELINILDITPADQNIMLVGKHGIGKSEILTDYFQKKDMTVVALFLGQMSDPGDLIGLPTKNEKTGKTDFMPPYWFPLDKKPIVLFLDELNRARPEVLQTIMDLALNRKLAGRQLPEGSRVISAVNDGEEYQLTDLDPALVSRFNVYGFRPTTQEWLLWASKNKLDQRVIEFIQNSPEYLDGLKDNSKGVVDSGLEKSPDRRAWKKVSDIIAKVPVLEDIHKKVIAGVVGVAATAKFIEFASKNNLISAKDVLLNFAKHEAVIKSYAIHQLSQINDSIFRYLETTKVTEKQKPAVKANIVAYFELLENTKKKEAIAHFATYFEQTNYPAAITFIMQHASELYMKIMDFISSI